MFRTYYTVAMQLVSGFVICGVTMLCAATALAGPKGAVGDLYVASRMTNTIVQVDGITGAIVGDFVTVGLDQPEEAIFGPNGNLFVVNINSNSVTEHDGNTGAFIGTFASAGMELPTGLRFKANGNLLVYNFITGVGNITEYDTAGNLIGTLITGLAGGVVALDIGPDGNLYVSDFNQSSVDQYSPDGTFLKFFANGNLVFAPAGHSFGPNGNLFVSDFNTDTVFEFDGTTGNQVRKITNPHFDVPVGLAFTPDGNMWITDFASGEISEFDGFTGTWIQQITGFSSPVGITVKPGPPSNDCLTMSVSSLIAGRNASWDVFSATPGSRVVVVYGFSFGSTIINNQLGYCATFGIMGVNQNKLVGSAIADSIGNVTIVKIIPGNASGLALITQAAEQGTCPDECVSNLDTQVVQ